MTGNKFFIFLFITIKITLFLSAEEENPYRTYVNYINEIYSSLSDQMKEELNLHCTGDAGSMHEKVQSIGLSFIAYRRATVDEARALELYVMQKFMERINAHEKIQPYLEVRPFSHEQISISIGFEGLTGRFADGTVSYICNAVGSLFYSTKDAFTFNNIEFLEEPYEEALQNAKMAGLSFPFTHKITDLETEMDITFGELSSQVWLKHGLDCWVIGGDTKNGIKEIGGTFRLIYPATQDEAREVAVYTVETLLKKLNQSEIIRPYLKEYPFPASRLKFTFNFQSRQSGDPLRSTPDEIEEVTLKDGEMSYFYTKRETPEGCRDGSLFIVISTELLAKEPYAESLKIVNQSPFSLSSTMHRLFHTGCRWLFVDKP